MRLQQYLLHTQHTYMHVSKGNPRRSVVVGLIERKMNTQTSRTDLLYVVRNKETCIPAENNFTAQF